MVLLIVNVANFLGSNFTWVLRRVKSQESRLSFFRPHKLSIVKSKFKTASFSGNFLAGSNFYWLAYLIVDT